jgi:hypothetical protein
VRGVPRLLPALAIASLLVTGSLAATVGPIAPTPAGADTDPTTLAGEGGSFFQPVIAKLLSDDTNNLNPLAGAYELTDDDSSIAAFVGSGPSQFSADYTVTQRPLTSTESGEAAANGRSYAYVPIAATPVAIATLVPVSSWSGTGEITSSEFCQGMQLSTSLLGQIFGFDAADPLHGWGDSRISCPLAGGGSQTADALPVAMWANLDPSMASYAMMTLLDSDPTSLAYFQAGLGPSGAGSLTTDTAPSELWPYAQNTIPGGDEPLIGKLLAVNPETNAPSTASGTWQLGAIAPISSVWTGAPLGVPWNLPTAAIQNAQGAFVTPSVASAQAAEADSTLAATSDPTTDNLVTFNPNPNDATAYNNYLMEEDYLVVPTNGLPADKFTGLAQLIRFVLGSQGQQDIERFGSAPADAAEQAAGLKIAAELSAAAAASPTPAPASVAASSTTAAAAAKGTSSKSGVSSGASGSASDASGSSGSSGAAADSSGGLAFTGAAHLGVWLTVGASMLLAGALLRRRLKRRETS